MAIETGSDQSAADGLNNVFMEDLKIFQSSAGILQLYSRLAQLGRQKASQVSHGKVGEQIHENDCLQRLQSGMSRAIRLHDPIVVEFQDGSVKDESESGNQMGPHPGKQNAGNNDDQRVEEIQRTIPTSRLMHNQADQDQVGQNLQGRLQPMFLPEGQQQHVEDGEGKPQHHGADEKTQRQGRGGEVR